MKAKPLAKMALLAILVLLLGLKTEPQSVVGLMRQGDACQSRKEYSAAIEAYQQATTLRPRSAAPHLRIGQVYLTQRRYELAGEALGQAYKLGAKREALAGLGSVYAGLGDEEQAIHCWSQALALDPTDTAVRYRLGRLYLERSDFRNAQREFEILIAQDERNPAAHYQMGLLLAGHDPQQATEHLTKAAGDSQKYDFPVRSGWICNPAVRPPNCKSGRSRSYSFTDAEDMLAALEQVEREENEARATALLGVAYLERGELSLARRQFEGAIRLHPDYAEAYAYLGHVQGQLGQYEAGWDNLVKAVTLEPDSVLAHYFLGVTYRSLGMWKAARTRFWRAVNLDPNNAALCVDLAQAYLEEPDYVAAEGWFRAAVQREPEDARFQLILAQFYVDHVYKVEEEGVPAALRAVELDAESAAAHDVLGWAYHLTGHWREARTHLQRALALEPDMARAHYHLGAVYTARGDVEVAQREYQRAIDLDSEGFYRQRAEKALEELNRP
ncbi:MAG: tetratricopeptide repeat protein [Anaerolineae bacterium]